LSRLPGKRAWPVLRGRGRGNASSLPDEAHFGPLRQFTLANSQHPNHTVQTRALHAYLRWRNANARHPEGAGRPTPRTSPHPQRERHPLGRPPHHCSGLTPRRTYPVIALATEVDTSAHARLLTILRSHSHLFRTNDSALSLYCHLFGRVTVTHHDEALPAWSLRPTRPLPTINNTGLLRSLLGHHGQVSSVQWMANDTLATVGGDDGTLRVWDSDTGRTQRAVEVSDHLILRSRLSPDGRLLAQLVHEHPLADRGRPTTAPEWYLRTVVTDARDGSVIAVDHLPWIDMFLEGPVDLHWNADSTLLAVAGGGCVRIWRPRTEPSTSPTQIHTVSVRGLSWHPTAGLVGISRTANCMSGPTRPLQPAHGRLSSGSKVT
jgi:WD domain, G-beta repeat